MARARDCVRAFTAESRFTVKISFLPMSMLSHGSGEDVAFKAYSRGSRPADVRAVFRAADVKKLLLWRSRILRGRLYLSPPQCIFYIDMARKRNIWRERATAGVYSYSPVRRFIDIAKQY